MMKFKDVSSAERLLRALDASRLSNQNLDLLRQMCELRGLSSEGKRSVLATRLVDWVRRSLYVQILVYLLDSASAKNTDHV